MHPASRTEADMGPAPIEPFPADASTALPEAPPEAPVPPAPGAEAPAGEAQPRPGFAHASEAEMARILDFYGVAWRYEPTTFPILWNLDGDVLESFSPDFYLPELDLYLEMTTLKQSLVRKKNRKLRRLRELYPDIRIKLFYARDFRAMMLKYGRLGLAESLVGTSGQLGGADAPRDPGRPTLPATPLVAAVLAAQAEPSLPATSDPIGSTGRPRRASRPRGRTAGRAAAAASRPDTELA